MVKLTWVSASWHLLPDGGWGPWAAWQQVQSPGEQRKRYRPGPAAGAEPGQANN